MGVCSCSMFCCMLLYVSSGIAVVLVGRRGLVALLGLSSWCLVMVERLFLAVPRGCLQFVIVVFPDHTHLLFSLLTYKSIDVDEGKPFSSTWVFIRGIHAYAIRTKRYWLIKSSLLPCTMYGCW